MTRVKVNKEIQYVYKVNGKQYVTFEEPLCDYRADVLLGRGTRVYDVYLRGADTDDIRNHFALKDLWIREGDEQEGEFLFNLREKMTEQEKMFFLEPVAYGPVLAYDPRKKKYVTDSTSSALSIPPGTKKTYMADYQAATSNIKPVEGSRRGNSRGFVPSIDDSKIRLLESATAEPYVCHREHSRTIFREICLPLHEVYNLQFYFQGIFDASNGKNICYIILFQLNLYNCLALKALHRLGFVHRDISTGNVLWCTHEGVAKLADLEYKKGLNDTFVSDDFRTVRTIFCIWFF